jgi:hypothetical protein
MFAVRQELDFSYYLGKFSPSNGRINYAYLHRKDLLKILSNRVSQQLDRRDKWWNVGSSPV